MSKVIFKSPYAKSKGHAATNLRYIAERDGVDKSINTIVNNMKNTDSVCEKGICL